MIAKCTGASPTDEIKKTSDGAARCGAREPCLTNAAEELVDTAVCVCACTDKVIRLNKLSNFVSMSESIGTAAVGAEVQSRDVEPN